MEAAEFTNRLSCLSESEIHTVAVLLRQELGTSDGEVSWWRATITVTNALRRHHLTRRAGLLAHEASQHVIEAAQRAGILETQRDDVTQVARAASEAARALMADESDEPQGLLARAIEPLLLPWYPLNPAVAAA